MMQNHSVVDQEDDQLDLPPGFRFHPTDEELITHYLSNKVVDCKFFAKAIGVVDMNKTEPWDLPGLAKMGGKEWYFFCVRDKKYPTGLRTNRATASGYWKATGKDKEIFRGRSLIGMKKTLVFYMGRAPKGEKTNWVIHEYRLEGKLCLQNLPKSAKNEWVICRVFHKKTELMRTNSGGGGGGGGGSICLPPLMETPAAYGGKNITPESVHVPCFSNTIQIQTTQKDMITCDQSILRGLIETYGHGLKVENEMVTGSQDTGVSSEKNIEISSRGIEAPPIDLDCLWNY